MQEGSPPDPAPESAPVEEVTTPPQPEAEEEVTAEERTPEQVEAIWKNRVAGKDRAHAAETATLRQQLDEERRQREALLNQQTSTAAGEQSEAAQWKAKAEEAERRATEAETQRTVEVRRAKYPAAIDFYDDATLATVDEAKLAALQAQLSGDETPPPPVIDPNSPRRQAAPSPSREKGIAELEADLKKYEPEFKAGLDL